MSHAQSLVCKECGARYPLEPRTVCDIDFGPVEVAYDYDAMRGHVTRQSIEAGPRSLWRYRDLLPIDGRPRAGLKSGWTPLVKADRLAAELGIRELYIKDDSANYPTFSYKDRVVAVALTKAAEFGFDTVGCASTGNLAHSVAAHAAAAGMRAFVVVPHDLEEGKMVGMTVFGPRVVRVRGNYDDVNRLCSQIADKYNWAIVNVNLRPYYTEGAKTHGFEIAEQLGWRLPKHTVVPVAGGTILPKVAKAYHELITLGLVEDNQPRFHGAQAAGCNPVVDAICKGEDIFHPQKPKTIAKSIAIGNPADGYYVIQTVRKSGGTGMSATDDEIIAAIKLLARMEGIFTEPAGGTTLACAIKLIQSGAIPRDESLCVCITGNGLKTLEVMQGQFAQSPVIEARLADFDRIVQEATEPAAANHVKGNSSCQTA
ncbi:MAG: threonine synthase [Phycisphaeraceae bacterium]|nr:threonine synthase [Phycisphaeraceae bacterium]